MDCSLAAADAVVEGLLADGVVEAAASADAGDLDRSGRGSFSVVSSSLSLLIGALASGELRLG